MFNLVPTVQVKGKHLGLLRLGKPSMEIPDNWNFKNREVAENFNEHVAEQLPWYAMATDMVAHLIRHYLPERGMLLDLGCSTGNITRAVSDVLKDRDAGAISVDNSQEMLDQFRGAGPCKLSNIEDFALPVFDVAVCMLSLMFVAPAKRGKLINDLAVHCRQGGIVIIVDKVEQESGYLGTVLTRLALSNKLASGCDPAEIVKKELSLAGVQRPLNPNELEDFTQWFQIGDFRGYVWEHPAAFQSPSRADR